MRLVFCPRCNHMLDIEKDNRIIFYKCGRCLWCRLDPKEVS